MIIRKIQEIIFLSPKNVIFLKTFDLKFSCNEVRFADQNYKLLEIEKNITLFIN